MNEGEWFRSNDPEAMFEVAQDTVFAAVYPNAQRTARRRLLFGAACCRLVWPWVAADERTLRWVEYIEGMEELELTDEERSELEDGLVWDVKMAAEHPDEGVPQNQLSAANLVYDLGDCRGNIAAVLRCFTDWGSSEEWAALLADTLRCIVGNPFRPATFDPTWRTPTVTALADAIYAERAFDRLPILADALEETGCDNVDVLSHCRSDGPHVRGCWVVDLALGKS